MFSDVANWIMLIVKTFCPDTDIGGAMEAPVEIVSWHAEGRLRV